MQDTVKVGRPPRPPPPPAPEEADEGASGWVLQTTLLLQGGP